MKKDADSKRFASLNISREYMGKIFSLLSAKQNQCYYDIFDIYDKVFQNKKIKFENFFVALLIFKELGFVELLKNNNMVCIKINKKEKKDLSYSKIYGKLSLLNKVIKEV